MSLAPEKLAAQLVALDLVTTLLPVAHHAAQLRAAGIRLAIDSGTREALQLLKDQGNQDAAAVLENAYPSGHIEVGLVK